MNFYKVRCHKSPLRSGGRSLWAPEKVPPRVLPHMLLPPSLF